MVGWIIKKKFLLLLLLILLVPGVFMLSQRREKSRNPKAPEAKFVDRIPVSVVKAFRVAVRDSFSTVGTLEAFREADIFSESAGIVRKVSAEPGDHKRAGEALFILDDELSTIRQRKAEAFFRQKKKDFERYKNLYTEGAIPLSAYEIMQLQTEDAEAELVSVTRKNSDAKIKSPFSGVVTTRFVEQGELVREGMKVAHLVDLTKVKVILFVPEREIFKFTEGAVLKVSSDLLPGEILTAKVSTVSDKSGRDHTYRVEMVLQNSGKARFRSGMFVRVLSTGKDDAPALVVPRVALVSGIRKPELFIVRNGKAFLKPFVVGRELHKDLEVLEGLAPGDSVVVSGQNELYNGANVLVIDQKKSTESP